MNPLSQAHPTAIGASRFSFREVSTCAEFDELLRLRYLVYSRHGYLDASCRSFAVDCYDRCSRFVAVYHRDDQGKETMIGGGRIVLSNGEPNAATLDEISRQARCPVPAPRKHVYSVQEFMNFDEVLSESRKTRCELVEFGRLFVHPDWQRAKLGSHLVYAAYGLALANGAGLGIGLVPPQLLGFYTRCGCRLIEGKGSCYALNHELVPVVVDLRATTESHREVRLAVSALQTSGCWTVQIRGTSGE